MSQTNGITQETQAIHLKPDSIVPWDGVLVKEKLFRFYRDQTDENEYLKSQLLNLQVPQCESDSSGYVILGILAFGVGSLIGALALSHR